MTTALSKNFAFGTGKSLTVFWGLLAFLLLAPLCVVIFRTTLDSKPSLNVAAFSKDVRTQSWSELLKKQVVTDYCGLRDWQVRQGYQILRRNYAERLPISFTRLQSLRREAVEATENVLRGYGLENYHWFCGTYGEEAVMFFISAWTEENASQIE